MCPFLHDYTGNCLGVKLLLPAGATSRASHGRPPRARYAALRGVNAASAANGLSSGSPERAGAGGLGSSAEGPRGCGRSGRPEHRTPGGKRTTGGAKWPQRPSRPSALPPAPPRMRQSWAAGRGARAVPPHVTAAGGSLKGPGGALPARVVVSRFFPRSRSPPRAPAGRPAQGLGGGREPLRAAPGTRLLTRLVTRRHLRRAAPLRARNPEAVRLARRGGRRDMAAACS